MARGTVKEWNDDEGYGVLVSPEVPGEVWAHFIHIQGQEGYRYLNAGDAVEFEFREPGQDGYSYAAVWVRRIGV